ncbi:hypothetical protein SELMODRAFT_430528 [Selaginella moellendorffii]|uniref:Uncharacterized protein n=1 Tax=Selaginella moellendorffii TaxID=88036 RepID=D8T9P3_SELML|nr:hypothetical protein SELMODRAFT_430528 [Selaginella moellendorffii]
MLMFSKSSDHSGMIVKTLEGRTTEVHLAMINAKMLIGVGPITIVPNQGYVDQGYPNRDHPTKEIPTKVIKISRITVRVTTIRVILKTVDTYHEITDIRISSLLPLRDNHPPAGQRPPYQNQGPPPNPGPRPAQPATRAVDVAEYYDKQPTAQPAVRAVTRARAKQVQSDQNLDNVEEISPSEWQKAKAVADQIRKDLQELPPDLRYWSDEVPRHNHDLCISAKTPLKTCGIILELYRKYHQYQQHGFKAKLFCC